MENWIRSSLCATDHQTGNCVEACRMESGEVLVRSSTLPGSTVSFDAGEWTTFIEGAKAGEFDLDAL